MEELLQMETLMLSFQEAQDFFDKLNPRHYMFYTGNQDKCMNLEFLSVVSVYKEIIFSRFTKKICFKDGENTLCLSDVKRIEISKEPSVGVSFYIICSDKKRKSGETKLMFIASKNF